MNKKEYLSKLRVELSGLPLEEIEDILSDYEEHFQIGMSKGKTEEEISRELGEPMEVAMNYKSSSYNDFTEEDFQKEDRGEKFRNIINIDEDTSRILVIIGLIAFNILVVLTPFVGILGILICFYATAISFLVAGSIVLVGSPFSFITLIPNPHILTSISFGIGFIALGILIMIFSIRLSRLFRKFTIKYAYWNMKLINLGGIR